MINQLHISTVNHDWGNTKLVPLNQRNIDKIINNTNFINCYTSPEDLGFALVSRALSSSVEIYIVDIDLYNTNLNNFDTYGRLLNELIRQQHKIVGGIEVQYCSMPTTSRLPGPILWTAGCSVTYGVSISPTQRFGTLVANSLNRQEVCLAQPGSSIFWAADRILRADLEPGDIVIWGLTDVPRVEISTRWKLSPVTINAYTKINSKHQYWNPDWFSSPTQTLMSLHYIDQVQNFCKKLNVELYLVNVLDITWISTLATRYSNYLDLVQNLEIKNNTVSFVDFGYDRCHPGPNQHQQWADQILNFINKSKNTDTCCEH
jgi:hypothetical protein